MSSSFLVHNASAPNNIKKLDMHVYLVLEILPQLPLRGWIELNANILFCYVNYEIFKLKWKNTLVIPEED